MLCVPRCNCGAAAHHAEHWCNPGQTNPTAPGVVRFGEPFVRRVAHQHVGCRAGHALIRSQTSSGTSAAWASGVLHVRHHTLGHPHRRAVHAGWGTTGTAYGGKFLGGPYLQSNDTTAAWMGGVLNASCIWLYNRNVTDPSSGLPTYQRAFQCVYGMQARRAPVLHVATLNAQQQDTTTILGHTHGLQVLKTVVLYIEIGPQAHWAPIYISRL